MANNQTMRQRIPADRLDALRRLAVAYYEAQHALELEFLDPWIDPATYTVDGVLDVDAYRQALIDMEAYTEEPEMKAIAKAPTKMEPYSVWSVSMFGHFNFEARRRLWSVKKMEESTDGKDN